MQKKFVWSEEYSVNIDEMDKQHQQFIEIVNELLDLVERDFHDREEILVKVFKLGDYANYHLREEEDMFLKSTYLDSKIHIEAHNKFREKIKELINEVRDENKDIKDVVKKTANFSGDWLLKHVLALDKQYSHFFNETGIK